MSLTSAGLIFFTLVFVIALALDFAVAKFAETRGHSFAKFFWLAFFLSPVIAVIVLLLSPTAPRKDFESRTGDVIFKGIDGDLGKCQKCAEMIKLEAKVCKHCGADVAEHFEKLALERELMAETSKIEQQEADARLVAERQAAAEETALRRKEFWRKKSTRIGVLLCALGVVVSTVIALTLANMNYQRQRDLESKSDVSLKSVRISYLDCSKRFSSDPRLFSYDWSREIKPFGDANLQVSLLYSDRNYDSNMQLKTAQKALMCTYEGITSSSWPFSGFAPDSPLPYSRSAVGKGFDLSVFEGNGNVVYQLTRTFK